MTDEVYVDLAALRAHKETVRALVPELDAAVQAIAQVTAPTTAYGILCSPLLLAPMALVQNDGIEGVNRMRDLMDAVADNLETTASTYEGTDSDVSTGMRRFDLDAL